MDKKTKILTFAAVALMFAVCFIGFVAIGDDVVDADGDDYQGGQGGNPTGPVTVEDEVVVAKIGDKEYETLAEAIEAIENEQAVGVITLVENVELNEVHYIAGEIMIDLNGKKISKGQNWNNNVANKDALICVKRGGTLTIKDSSNGRGIIDGTGLGTAIKMTEFISETDKNATGADAKLYVENGSITSDGYAIAENGTRNGTYIKIIDGTFTSTGKTTIYLPQKGVTKIEGGTFTGKKSAIEIRSGSLEISGGTFKSEAESFSVEANGSGPTTSGAAIAIAQHTTKQAIDVKITGGEFEGLRSINESNPQANKSPDVVIDIQGGTFNGIIAITEKNKANVSVECAFIVESEGEKRWSFDDSEIVYAVNWINRITSGNVTLTLNKEIVVTEKGNHRNAALWFTNKNTTILVEGNGNTIKYNVVSQQPEEGYNVLGFYKDVTATIKSLTVDGMNKSWHGFNIVEANEILLDNVIVKDVGRTGVNVNCTSITMKDCNVNPSGVNVDNKGCVVEHKLTVDGKFSGKIWTETSDKYDIDYNSAILTVTIDLPVMKYMALCSPDYDFTPDMRLLPPGTKVVLNDDLTLPDESPISLNSGVELKISDGKTFNGIIYDSITNDGPSNGLLAKGLKAGEGGITITGGSLIINGKIIDASGVEGNVTVTVEGNGIYINGSLEPGAMIQINGNTTVTIEDEESFVSKGVIINEGTITNNGTFTNEYKLIIAGDDAMINGKDIINNGVIIDKRKKGAEIVPIDTDSKGIVVSRKNSKLYEDEGFEAVAQNPDIDVKPEGMIKVDINKFAFIDPITTTGKLDIVMNDGNREYTITIPEGTTIALGTVITVKFIEHQSFATKYYINTPGIENFSVKLPCQIGFKKAKVLCDDSELGISEVRYNKGTGYVTFDAAHNSVFTIILSEASPANVTTTSGGNATNDYSLVIAFVVLVASLGFLVYVIRKKQ